VKFFVTFATFESHKGSQKSHNELKRFAVMIEAKIPLELRKGIRRSGKLIFSYNDSQLLAKILKCFLYLLKNDKHYRENIIPANYI